MRGSKFPVFLALALSWLAHAPGADAGNGDVVPIGGEFQVNEYTTGYQSTGGPSVVDSADDGSFVVVWQSDGQDGDADGIVARRFSATSSPFGSEFVVNSYTTDRQYLPAVAVHGDGSFVVVWASERSDESQLFARRFDNEGTPVGGEFQVNSVTGGVQFFPDVAGLADGGFVVAWQAIAAPATSYDIFGQRFNSAGVRVGDEFVANTERVAAQRRPAVAGDGAGGFVMVWESADQDGSGYGVFGQRFDASGTPVGSEFQANSETQSSQWYPSVAVREDGEFLVVWGGTGDQDGDLQGVFAQCFDNEGEPNGSEFQVNTYTTGYQQRPTAASFRQDNFASFVISWESDGQDGDLTGIIARRYESCGQSQNPEFVVNTGTQGAQVAGGVATANTDTFFVVWTSETSVESEFDVFRRRYGRTGLSTTTSSTTTTTLPTGSTTTTTLPGGVRCGQPATDGPTPLATDCLVILRAAVGLVVCSPECICAPKGSLPVTATDSLICLNVAVGVPGVDLNCNC